MTWFHKKNTVWESNNKTPFMTKNNTTWIDRVFCIWDSLIHTWDSLSASWDARGGKNWYNKNNKSWFNKDG